MSASRIPFLDLVTPHLELESELVAVFRQALRSAAFIGGPMVDGFEQQFATFCSTERAVVVSSGTDALRFALIAAGIRPGDVVLTVPNTFIATTEAISQAGAHPEFVDIDERTYNMDPKELRRYLETECSVSESGRLLSKKHNQPVRAVIPVHLYGQMADMDPILELAEQYGLVVIEDACQAHGAEYFSRKQNRWFKAGSLGRAAAFSFYPGKNLGACGEGGAVTTNDHLLAHTIKKLRDHGQAKKYYHDIEGYNGRLDSIQTGILSVKLKHLTEWNLTRRHHAKRYKDLFAGCSDVQTPFEHSWSKAIYHLYVVRTNERDRLIEFLQAAGIGTGIHYPIPLHLQRAYQHLGCNEGAYPVTERVAREIVSLPMFPQLTAEQQCEVAAKVLEFVQSLPQTTPSPICTR